MPISDRGRLATLLCIIVAPVGAQTQLHLATQGKAVNFSTASATIPAKSDNTLPAVCAAGELFFLKTAPPGQNLHGCTAGNTWTPVSNGVSEHKTLEVTRLSATQLRIGENCQTAAPCRVRIGRAVYVYTNPATVSLSGTPTGTAYLFISTSGVLTVLHNLSISCSGCAQSNGSSFPDGAIPLASWTAAAGAWDTAGTDFRAFLGRDLVAAGAGVVVTEGVFSSTVSLNTAVVGLRTAVPGSSTSTCEMGSWAADASFFYLCVATDSWRRAALANW